MRRIIHLLIFILIINFFASAQTFEWLRTVPMNFQFNPGMIKTTISTDPEGNICFFGLQEYAENYIYALGPQFLHKYDADGTILWQVIITGNSYTNGAVFDQEGNMYIYGLLHTDLNFWGEEIIFYSGFSLDAFIAKISHDGHVLWTMNMTDSQYGQGELPDAAFDGQDRLCVLYAAGSSSYILMYDGDGNYLQSITQDDVPVVSSIDIDNIGNIFIAGSCAGAGATYGGQAFPSPFIYNLFLVKYNSGLQPDWVKYVEDITCTSPQVKASVSGKIYFSGSLNAETWFDQLHVNGPEWVYDFFLSCLGPDGNFEWAAECPEVMTGDASIGSNHYLDADNNGNALLGGFTRGLIDWGNGIISDATGNYQDLIVWNFSAQGTINWIKTAGGPWYEDVHTISAISSGDVIISGVAGGTTVWDTITYQTTDYAYPILAKISLSAYTGLASEISENNDVFFPNPSKDRVFLTAGVFSYYAIFDMYGKQVCHGNLQVGEREISISMLKPGTYLICFNGQTTVRNLKLIII